MYTIQSAAASVTGARHLRVARNGQDAAAVWVGDDCGAVIVCDGCSSGAYSEVGARLGAQLGIQMLGELLGGRLGNRSDGRLGNRSDVVDGRLENRSDADGRLGNRSDADDAQRGNRSDAVDVRLTSAVAEARTASDLGVGLCRPRDIWPAVRARLVAELARIADAMPGPRERVVHDHFLFTIVAAAWRGDEVAVWALGDGGYALGDRVVELGPFANNQPPYLGYDLLGNPQPAHLEVAAASCGRVAVATDGVIEVGLTELARDRKLLAHPDALRRRLAVLAQKTERIDWDEQRVVRQAAQLQDDGAVAMLRWEIMS